MLAIDANIFLEVLLDQEKSSECQEFLQKVLRGEIRAMASDFTVDGVLLAMERNGLRWKSMKNFLISLMAYKNLIFYSPTISDKIAAAELMQSRSLDFEDSLTLQCAVAAQCKGLVSFDSDFNRIKEMKKYTPGEILKEF